MSSILIYDRLSISLTLHAARPRVYAFTGSVLFPTALAGLILSREGRCLSHTPAGSLVSPHELSDTNGSPRLLSRSQSRPYIGNHPRRRNVLAPSELRRLDGSYVRRLSIQAVLRLLEKQLPQSGELSQALPEATLEVNGYEVANDTTYNKATTALAALRAASQAAGRYYPNLSQLMLRSYRNYIEWAIPTLDGIPHRNERLKIYLKGNSRGGNTVRCEYAWSAGNPRDTDTPDLLNDPWQAPAPLLVMRNGKPRLVDATDRRRSYASALYAALEAITQRHRRKLPALTTGRY